ncbi:hypothetical protein LIA77_03164 [Sarocladium implicatum]|nr:hypothetical protein LIA77_03164 [Sarocladium implicatum]
MFSLNKSVLSLPHHIIFASPPLQLGRIVTQGGASTDCTKSPRHQPTPRPSSRLRLLVCRATLKPTLFPSIQARAYSLGTFLAKGCALPPPYCGVAASPRGPRLCRCIPSTVGHQRSSLHRIVPF